MTRSEIEALFDSNIKEIFKEKDEIKRFLLNHERKPLCIASLCDQVSGFDIFYRPRTKEVHSIIRDVAKMFAGQCLEHKEQELMSSAERARRIQKANYINDAETTFLEDQKKEALSESHSVFVPGRRDIKNK